MTALVALDERGFNAISKIDLESVEIFESSNILANSKFEHIVYVASDIDDNIVMHLEEKENEGCSFDKSWLVVSKECIDIENDNLVSLLSLGFRIVAAQQSTLVSISLYQSVEALLDLLNPNSNEEAVSIDIDDLMQVIPSGSVVEWKKHYGISLATMMTKIFNRPKLFEDVVGACFCFTLHPDWPMADLTAAMEVAEAALPDGADILYGTAYRHEPNEAVVTVWIARRLDFIARLRKELEQKEDVFKKMVLIRNALDAPSVSTHEVLALASMYGITENDVAFMDDLIKLPDNFAKLLTIINKWDKPKITQCAAEIANHGLYSAIMIERLLPVLEIDEEDYNKMLEAVQNEILIAYDIKCYVVDGGAKFQTGRLLDENLIVVKEGEMQIFKDYALVDSGILKVIKNGQNNIYVDKDIDKETLEKIFQGVEDGIK